MANTHRFKDIVFGLIATALFFAVFITFVRTRTALLRDPVAGQAGDEGVVTDAIGNTVTVQLGATVVVYSLTEQTAYRVLQPNGTYQSTLGVRLGLGDRVRIRSRHAADHGLTNLDEVEVLSPARIVP